MDHLPGAAFIKDAEGRYTFVNKAARRFLAFRSADHRNHDSRILPPEVVLAASKDERVLREHVTLQSADRARPRRTAPLADD
jgi:PAS domain-containing protein